MVDPFNKPRSVRTSDAALTSTITSVLCREHRVDPGEVARPKRAGALHPSKSHTSGSVSVEGDGLNDETKNRRSRC